jgi:VIT1/CCC1 family predicted Fe2+/Mn2+ transporter
MSDPKMALETLAREELGLDPDELGSPIKVAIASFVSFAIGASFVVLPYFFLTGTAALITAICLALLAMIAVGATVGKLSGRNVFFSVGRQLMWGVGAAAVTFAIGKIVSAVTGTSLG